MVEKFDNKDLEGSILEFRNGSKIRIEGFVKVQTPGIGHRAEDPSEIIEELVRGNNGDCYLITGSVAHKDGVSFGGKLRGNTSYFALYGNVISD